MSTSVDLTVKSTCGSQLDVEGGDAKCLDLLSNILQSGKLVKFALRSVTVTTKSTPASN